MYQKENNYAFIDGQNLNLGIKNLGWNLDFRRFRIYLKQKYKVVVAYYFIGYMPENQDLYSALQKCGYNQRDFPAALLRGYVPWYTIVMADHIKI